MKKVLSKRVISGLMGGIIAIALFMLPIFSETSFAADAVSYTLPVNYYTSPTNSTTANVTVTMSTKTLKKGTVINLSGVPSGCVNYDGGYEQVDIEEINSAGKYISTASFGGDATTPITNGTVSYKVKNNISEIVIIFGSWFSGFEGGMDASFTMDKSGTLLNNITNTVINATPVTATSTAASTDSSSLANASVNNSEFNAKTYFDNYADLQTAIGPNAQALYDHWVKFGKAEGRKAK